MRKPSTASRPSFSTCHSKFASCIPRSRTRIIIKHATVYYSPAPPSACFSSPGLRTMQSGQLLSRLRSEDILCLSLLFYLYDYRQHSHNLPPHLCNCMLQSSQQGFIGLLLHRAVDSTSSSMHSNSNCSQRWFQQSTHLSWAHSQLRTAVGSRKCNFCYRRL